MSYKLTRYHNRLGNNIRQVINACTAAHKDGAHGVIIPRHRCFKKTFIPIHNNNSEKRKRKTWFHTPKQRKCMDTYDAWICNNNALISKYKYK